VLAAVAQVVPLTYVFEAVRIGLETSTVAWGQLGIAAAGTLVLLALSSWFLAHQLRRFRVEGWVTRFT
jgi:ABC-2 type transport system permease protein